MMKWIDNTSYPIFIGVALLAAILPIQGDSHLLEKLTMLMDGTLTGSLDMFDLAMHSFPAFILLVKVLRNVARDKD